MSKELGYAQFRSNEDAWVEVEGITVKFFSRYNDYAFTQAKKLVQQLNSNSELRQQYYDDAVKKIYKGNQ